MRELSTRAQNAMQRHGLTSRQDVFNLCCRKLHEIKGVGTDTFTEILNWMDDELTLEDWMKRHGCSGSWVNPFIRRIRRQAWVKGWRENFPG